MAKSRPQVTYKGITPETQDVVRVAARASGMTIGAWVQKALLESANKQASILEPDNASLASRVVKLENIVSMLLENYYLRHPKAQSVVPTTHTGRILAAMEHSD
jgi:hypothetical protein